MTAEQSQIHPISTAPASHLHLHLPMKMSLRWLLLLSLFLSTPMTHGASLCSAIFSTHKDLSTLWTEYQLTRHEKGLELAIRSGGDSLELWIAEKYEILQAKQNLKSLYQQKIDFKILAEQGVNLPTPHLRMKIKIALNRMLNSPLLRLTSLPFLPNIKNSKITEETLSLWIHEGYAKHQHEIDAFMVKQSNIDNYRQGRKVWNHLVNLTIAYMVISMLVEFPDEIEKLSEKILSASNQKVMENTLDSLPVAEKLARAQAQASLDAMVDRFIKKYGEPPNQEEYNYLKSIADKDYGL